MAEIKGLQVDVSMDTTKFEQGYANIKRSMATFNTVLKTTRNQLKYNEKTQEGFKNHMNNLKGAIENSEKNIEQLGKAYDSLSEKQKQGVKGNQFISQLAKEQDNLRRLRNELHETEMTYASTFTTMGKIGQSFKSIGSGLQGVGQKAQDMGRSLTNSITKPALVAGTAMAGITAKLGFDRLVGLDTAKAKLEGLGYSTKEVGNITDQVAKAIEGGMTTMAEGTDVAAGALAAGVKEGKDLQHYIKLVGDAAVGANRPVGDMAMIFNRVQGMGKLMTEELNMIEEGMPGFATAMSKHLGVSQEEFRKMVTEGKVSSEDFMTVMDDFAGGMANSYAKSWQGMVQNTKAYIGILGENLLSGVFEQSKDGLREFEKLLQSPVAQQWAKDTGEQLGSAFSKIANGIKGIINWWQSLDGSTQKTLGGIVKWLGITLVTMGPVLTIFGKMASTIGGMFSGMSSLIQFFIRHNGAAKVSAASQAIWNGVTATARGIANGYRAAMTALTTSQTIQAIKSRIAATAMTIWTGVTKAAALATRGLGLAIRFMTGPIGIVITVITALVGAIIYLWKTNSTFRNAVITAWNAIKNAAISIFGFIKPYIINIWNAIKNSTIAIWSGIKTSAVTIWNGIKFAVQHPIQALKNVLSALWNGMKAAAIKIWTLLKNGVLAIIRAYVAQVRTNFNLVKRIVITIFNGIKDFSIRVWNTIKNSVINRARGLWNGVRSAFNALKKGTTDIMNSVGGFMSKKWKDIKNGTVNLVTGMKDKVTGVMNKMGDAIKSVTGKIKGFFSGMIKGVKKGLNALIKGVNWVGDKLGMDKLPEIKLSRGTTSTHTRNVVTNGKINRPTLATVNDKGPGNGSGPNGHREIIRRANGTMFSPKGKNVTMPLNKGDSVLSGRQTQTLQKMGHVPQFSKGTGLDLVAGGKKAKKHKHKENIFGDVADGAKAAMGKVVDGGKAVVSTALQKAGQGTKWLKDKVGDVLDWIDKPGKLLDHVLNAFGVNFDFVKGDLPKKMMGAMFKKLKSAAIKTFESWFEESGGGEGGWVDISKGVNFPFSPNGRAPGYPFPYPHMGVDLNYVYDKLYSTHSGTATAKTGYNGGFGNMVSIMSGIYEIIYGHMSKHAFSGSKKVKPGTYLGVSGNTGMSSGPHLHYEMRKNGKPIDPMPFLRGQTKGGGKSGGSRAASKWRPEIVKALKANGLPTSSNYVNAWIRQVQSESGGNAGARQQVQDVNSGPNAARGLLQVIPTTFAANKLPGHGNIMNGLDNAMAAINYAKKRYGRTGMLQVIGHGHGYATGGLINTEGWYNLAEGGYPEIVVPTDPAKASDAMKLIAIASERVSQRAKNNKRPNQLRMPSTSNTNDNEMINFMARQLEATQRQVELLTQLVASSQRLEQKPTGVSEKKLSQQQAKRLSFETYSLGGSF